MFTCDDAAFRVQQLESYTISEWSGIVSWRIVNASYIRNEIFVAWLTNVAATLSHNASERDVVIFVVNNLKQIENELLQEKELFTNRPFKRSSFNIVGNIEHALFGVLDSDYAEEVLKTINKAKLEHDHMTNLLKNQSLIIDLTTKAIKQDEINTR